MTIVSCSKSPEELAKGLIDQRIHETLPNIKSYEPISFGTLDSAGLNPYMLPEYNNWFAKLKSAASEMKYQKELADLSLSKSKKIEHLAKCEAARDEVFRMNDSIDKLTQNFTYDSAMLSMTHNFRYYNEEKNRHEIVRMTFYFDKDIQYIKGVSTPSEEEPVLEIYYGILK